jgi:hypothetical protein
MVPGLYAGIRLEPEQGPWKFDTNRQERVESDGTRVITVWTDITRTAEDGTTYTGDVTRIITLRPNATGGYDVGVKMDMAFIDSIPDTLRWVNEGGVPLRPGRGIPLQTYVTLMQMRMEGVGLGQVTTSYMSMIVNARTICELASFRQRFAPGVAPDQLPSRIIERTQSGNYGVTNLTQAGVKVRGLRIQGGNLRKVESVVNGTEMDNDKTLADLGLTRDQQVLANFNIIIDIEPPQPLPPASGGTTP